MHWYERRFQNPDGTLTPEGRKRYAKNIAKVEKLEGKLAKAKASSDKTTMRYAGKTAQLESRAARKMIKTNRLFMTEGRRQKLLDDAERLKQRAAVGNSAMAKANAKVSSLQAKIDQYKYDIDMLEKIADKQSIDEIKSYDTGARGYLADEMWDYYTKDDAGEGYEEYTSTLYKHTGGKYGEDLSGQVKKGLSTKGMQWNKRESQNGEGSISESDKKKVLKTLDKKLKKGEINRAEYYNEREKYGMNKHTDPAKRPKIQERDIELEKTAKTSKNPIVRDAYNSVLKTYRTAEAHTEVRYAIQDALVDAKGRITDAEYKRLEDDFDYLMNPHIQRRK